MAKMTTNQLVSILEREARIHRMYGRGHIRWDEGMDRLKRLGVTEDRARKVLLGLT